MKLTIGRVGLEVELNRPGHLETSAEPASGRRVALEGHIHVPGDVDDAVALRDELVAQAHGRPLIAVTLDADSRFDGFAWLESVRTVTAHELASLQRGRFPFAVELMWVGNASTHRFESRTSGKTLANDHGYSGPGSGLVGPPIGFYASDPSFGSNVVRAGATGTHRTLLGVAATDHPAWSIEPAAFYAGACEISIGGYVRAGRHAPNTPSTWQIGNPLVRVTPGSSGAINVEHYDGTAWRSKVWAVKVDGTAVGDWEAVHIWANRPERAVLRLSRSRAGGSRGRLVLELGVRRGSRIVDGQFLSDLATGALRLDAAEAGTVTGPPAGSMIAASATNGHKWMVGSERSTTLSEANGRITKTAARLPFMISKQINEGAGVQTGDTDDDLWDQHMEWRSETVWPTTAGTP